MTYEFKSRSHLIPSLLFLSQVLLVWPLSSTSSASSNWPPKTSSSLLTVASEVPSPSPWASCWTRTTFPWERCSSPPSSPSSSSPSSFRWEQFVYCSCWGLNIKKWLCVVYGHVPSCQHWRASLLVIWSRSFPPQATLNVIPASLNSTANLFVKKYKICFL